jgi:sec-independent protein translocase protein TatB
MLRPMFGMGMTEILVILVIAMIFLGPEKLPEAAAKISKGIREIRKQSKELQNTIETDTEIGGAIRDLKSALRGDEIRRPPVRKVPDTPPAEALAAAPAEPVPVPVPEEPAVAEAPAAETPAPAEPAEDDPIRLIRPAAGTAKREHG